METEVTALARELIGLERVREFEVTQRDISRYAQAIGDDNPLYYDEEYARTTRYKAVVAPPLFCHALVFEDLPVEQLPPDGSPAEADVPIPAKRMVGGGSVFENYIRIRPGDRILIKSKIKDIFSKQGRQGLLYFIVLETSFYNRENKLAARETATFIKRI